MTRLAAALIYAVSLFAAAATADEVNDRILEQHVLPGYATLKKSAGALSKAAREDCSPTSPVLRDAFHDSFDAWLRVSHLRFGPSEIDNRAFALSFWPDPRSKRRKALNRLIADRDAVVDDAEAFKLISVAGRGFYALELLLFGPQSTDAEEQAYRCALTAAVARDIAGTASVLEQDWWDRYASLVQNPGKDGSPYQTELEVKQEFFKALSTGLQFASEARLGRPLGTFERPRPRRAEARLSERSLRNLTAALDGQKALAKLIASTKPEIAAKMDAAFAAIDAAASEISTDPVFAAVADVQGRLRVEVLQQRIDEARNVLLQELGPALGVSKGFNALDGD